MRNDRKRLKSDKLDLLNQSKELYKKIESKENEIRDFLRHYEAKTKETSFAVKKVCFTILLFKTNKNIYIILLVFITFSLMIFQKYISEIFGLWIMSQNWLFFPKFTKLMIFYSSFFFLKNFLECIFWI